MGALHGDARTTERDFREREHPVRHVFSDTDGPAGVSGGSCQSEGGAAATLQAGGGDGPLAKLRGHAVEGVAFADGAEVEVQSSGVRRERVGGWVEGEEGASAG